MTHAEDPAPFILPKNAPVRINAMSIDEQHYVIWFKDLGIQIHCPPGQVEERVVSFKYERLETGYFSKLRDRNHSFVLEADVIQTRKFVHKLRTKYCIHHILCDNFEQ